MPKSRIQDYLLDMSFPERVRIKDPFLTTGWLSYGVSTSKLPATLLESGEISEKSAGDWGKFIKDFVEAVRGKTTENIYTEFKEEIALLKRENRELKKKIDKLYAVLKPFIELVRHEKALDAKILKEMPELKFKKKDPFKLEKGDWVLPYEKLKEILEE